MIKEIFKKMAEIRYFELGLIEAHKKGLIYGPVYLSMGQEAVAATLGVICPDFKVFPQHRGHGVYLAYGGSPECLRDEILGKSSGCCKGMGGSSDIQCEKVEAHHGLMGENIPLAVGYALGSDKKTIAFFGDGSVEQDYALTALGFAVTRKLPVLFVCEDNGLAILTPIKDRRSWVAVDVAKGFGIEGIDIEDRPEEIVKCLKDVKLPFFINIRTCRHRFHVGVGTDYEVPPFDRLAEVRKQIPESNIIEEEVKSRMEKVWNEI